jgi:hypothetical protein
VTGAVGQKRSLPQPLVMPLAASHRMSSTNCDEPMSLNGPMSDACQLPGERAGSPAKAYQ